MFFGKLRGLLCRWHDHHERSKRRFRLNLFHDDGSGKAARFTAALLPVEIRFQRHADMCGSLALREIAA
jgi:hypothetical protein